MSTCTLCGNNYKTFGSSTSNLKKHLATMHSIGTTKKNQTNIQIILWDQSKHLLCSTNNNNLFFTYKCVVISITSKRNYCKSVINYMFLVSGRGPTRKSDVWLFFTKRSHALANCVKKITKGMGLRQTLGNTWLTVIV